MLKVLILEAAFLLQSTEKSGVSVFEVPLFFCKSLFPKATRSRALGVSCGAPGSFGKGQAYVH